MLFAIIWYKAKSMHDLTQNRPTIFDKRTKPVLNGFLAIDDQSKVPKYQQIVDTIVSDIERGIIKVGEKIPSINETSEEFYLSRDTVEKAYKILCKRGVITAVRGKGFYVSSTSRKDGKRILLVFNKLSDHKKTIYNSFVKNLDNKATVDLQIHHGESSILEKIIIENLGMYDHYLIMPHLTAETDSVIAALNKIPPDQLVLINKDISGISGEYASVFEDFELDIHTALCSGLDKIRKYSRLILVFPTQNLYCNGIRKGFENFCIAERFDFQIIESAAEHEVNINEMYIVIEEADLVEIIKKATANNYVLGENFGLISYNDTPFKEILAGGIAVLSTDFVKMGETMASMVFNHTKGKIKNPFKLISRNSI
jgi:DNA-binding transcriptional regulator YhcF (GntR family)